MKASDAALEAAGIISRKGLVKGQLRDSEGRVCHNGAVFLACTGDALGAFSGSSEMMLANEVIARSAIILRRREPDFALYPSSFNDLPETSAEDVILLLKENAALDDDLPVMAEIADRRKSGEFHRKLHFPSPFIFPSFPSSFSITPFS